MKKQQQQIFHLTHSVQHICSNSLSSGSMPTCYLSIMFTLSSNEDQLCAGELKMAKLLNIIAVQWIPTLYKYQVS